MNYKDIELEEEELKVPGGAPSFHFNITDMDMLQFLQRQINTYRQFKKFPSTHRSFKSLQYTGAMYERIYEAVLSTRGSK